MKRKRLWAMGLENDKIWVLLDCYDPDINEALKTNLPGPPRFNRNAGRWEFPVHWDSCTGARKVADKYGADLKISKELTEWALKERERIDAIPDVKSMELVDLPGVAAESPSLSTALSNRPFQTVGAAFAARNRSCLIADEPGLGKTLQAIGAVMEAGITGPILVVAPKSAAALTWVPELKRWAPDDMVYLIGDNLKPAERQEVLEDIAADIGTGKRTWVLTSPYYVRIRVESDQYQNYVYKDGKKIVNAVGSALLKLFDIKWGALIVDESHDTLAGATGNKKKQSSQRLGLGALEVSPGGLRIAMSGTPSRGKESYLWGQLNWLRPDLYRSYHKWVDEHFDTWFDRWGGKEIGHVKNRAKMYAEAANVMIRRTKPEVAKDLPDKDYGGWLLDPDKPEGVDNPKAVWLDMVPKQRTAYNEMMKNAAVELEGGTLLTNGILAEMTRLKQFAGSYGKVVDEEFIPTLPSNKFDWLVEFLDERGVGVKDSDDCKAKVVVVSQFAKLLEAFAKGLEEQGIKTHLFTGATSAAKREAIKDDWQTNPDSEYRVLLLSTKAGGVSLTLDAADEMVILDETWAMSDQKQVEDRIHRLSRIHQVVIWKVFSRNTIEEGIARNNLASEASITGIMDVERLRAIAKGAKL
jgi:SNF2 family DNA or RNA helicase